MSELHCLEEASVAGLQATASSQTVNALMTRLHVMHMLHDNDED